MNIFKEKFLIRYKHQRELDRNKINYGKNKTRNLKGTFIRYSFNKLSSGKKNMEFRFIVGLCGSSEYTVHCQICPKLSFTQMIFNDYNLYSQLQGQLNTKFLGKKCNPLDQIKRTALPFLNILKKNK